MNRSPDQKEQKLDRRVCRSLHAACLEMHAMVTLGPHDKSQWPTVIAHLFSDEVWAGGDALHAHLSSDEEVAETVRAGVMQGASHSIPSSPAVVQ